MQILSQDKIDTYYRALLARDSKYVGVFYVGVKTTSVFCIATCRARKPKKENVVFYSSFKTALAHGFRPCKVCKPTENAAQPPEEVKRAILLVKGHPTEKISDEKLREEGISPDLVRRWFKKNYGLTFHSFQRMSRINHAYQELKDGKKATAVAFDSGYGSLSGFGYTYKKLLGKAPLRSTNQDMILTNRITTPLGPMLVGATSRGVCLLEFTDRKMLETELRDLQRLLGTRIIVGENQHIAQVRSELAEYFQGSKQKFDVALDAPGTDFQEMVWQSLRQIPFGSTRSYQQQAQEIGRPQAIRAVASANGHNRISIVVPCHRVIGKDGNLTGYGGGLERKRWLLAFEREVASK
ncbi:MAG: methylated-DNA--[protein]-cysteine S-methyltransferase [Bacteroidota bacterium]